MFLSIYAGCVALLVVIQVILTIVVHRRSHTLRLVPGSVSAARQTPEYWQSRLGRFLKPVIIGLLFTCAIMYYVTQLG